ncbi:protein D2-like [Copidosoma floridanum]|uniref:protein D2-like n=1 Tax=Copidosoma floridanum TaxID=29053 RepID=UPI0006C95BBE|nr:protein D2-like [Copidosoma floridanum]
MRFIIAGLLLGVYAFAANIPSEFASTGIVPDVLSKAPNELLSISYKDADGKEKDVAFGEELTPTMVKDPPALAWYNEDSAYYVVAMIDPDAPSHEDPKMREMLHWLVANVQGGDMSKSETIVEYTGSGPRKDTGLHRYVILVYKQPGKLSIDEPRIPKTERGGRANFAIRNFADKYKLGEPVSGNMFRAQYDDYVPVLMKQMGVTE